MRRRQLKRLWARLAELKEMAVSRYALLLKLGSAKQQYSSAWKLARIDIDADGVLSYSIDKDRLRRVLRREGAPTFCAPISAPKTQPASGACT